MNKPKGLTFQISILIALAVLAVAVAGGVAILPTKHPYPESCPPGQAPIYEGGVFSGCAEPTPSPSSDSVSWEEAKRLILNGQVSAVYQSHSLLVTLVLKDGSRKTTTAPKIDIVFDVVRQCGQLCSGIITATE